MNFRIDRARLHPTCEAECRVFRQSPICAFRYEYDFGDGWDHIILVEKISPSEEGKDTMVCLAGRGRCPPEDCGGIWGYQRILDILQDADGPEYEETVDSYGEIDPREFDVNEVTKALRTL